mgnify:CR=1 FL=1
MKIKNIDHIVIPVSDIDKSLHFYTKVLGMEADTSNQRFAVKFGNQKINLHEKGKEFEPKAGHPTPGSADLCFITAEPISDVIQHLASCGLSVIEGPIQRTGATGPILSIYLRDPDANLIEISNQLNV